MKSTIGFWFFARLLGVCYFFAFLSLLPQLPGLLGPNGILPAQSFLAQVTPALAPSFAPLHLPSLAWLIGTSDFALQLLAIVGLLSSLLLACGLLRPLSAALSWLCWLSLVNLGQDFLSFQWDTLLLEAGFLCIFLEKPGLRFRSPGQDSFPLLLRLALFFLIFRLMISSGAVKILSADPTWSDLSALTYHFQTQPIPNLPAWFFQQLPPLALRLATLLALLIELLFPFAILAPAPARLIAALSFLSLQLLIAFTGNYAFFNLLTLALTLPLIADRFWPASMRRHHLPAPITPVPWRHFASFAALLQLSLSVPVLFFTLHLLPRSFGSSWQESFAPWHLTSSYGLFAVMTTRRPEITIEQSADGQIWQPILFSYKAGPADRMPPQIAPLQPRLDWQMWFAALSAERGQLPGWCRPFLQKLQQGDPRVWRLLGSKSTPPPSPLYLRLRLDQYRFTTFTERASSGNWWHIEEGPILLVLSPP